MYVTVNTVDDDKASVKITEKSFVVHYHVNSDEKTLEVPLYSEIDVNESKYVKSRGISLILVKKEAKSWESLTPVNDKRRYIKIDWSRWVDSDDEDEKNEAGDFNMDGLDFSKFGNMGGMPGMGGMPDMSNLDGMPGMGDLSSMNFNGAKDDKFCGDNDCCKGSECCQEDECCGTSECCADSCCRTNNEHSN